MLPKNFATYISAAQLVCMFVRTGMLLELRKWFCKINGLTCNVYYKN